MVDKIPHLLLTMAKQHVQEINIHIYETLNHLGPMVFT